jgi:hypothetical protein
MLIEREIAARRERAQAAVARILARPDGNVYGDYQIRSLEQQDLPGCHARARVV